MYHTFQASSSSAAPHVEGDSSKSSKSSGSRRISTSNACIECRRRKIRCDGNQPCGQCLWYQHPEICAYAKPAQRMVPSKKLVEKLQSRIDQYQAILARLFPGKDLEDFASLPREGLINLAVTLPASSTSPITTTDQIYRIPEQYEDASSLEELDGAPDDNPRPDGSIRSGENPDVHSDAAHGLSLSGDPASSYVGVSSINAAIKVILKTAPVARPFITQAAAVSGEPSRSSTPALQQQDPDPDFLPPPEIGQVLIDFYFTRVHGLVPLIDEEFFRHTYLHRSRKDSPWLALLNMVLALGSLASSTADNEDHLIFSQRARKHLVMETFGSSSLVLLQALCLFSGYTSQWLNRPNEANGLMGAALRMATTHGLHRESRDANEGPTGLAHPTSQIPAEIRRRTWWALYCFDSWTSITTGRPSLGRTGVGITVQIPRIPDQLRDRQRSDPVHLLCFIGNIELCKIATKVQDTLAAKSIIGFGDLFALDAELEKWHDDLPPILTDLPSTSKHKQRAAPSTPGSGRPSPRGRSVGRSKRKAVDGSKLDQRDMTACPDTLVTPRAILHWRYQNLRMLMNRPWLLATALRQMPHSEMSAEEKIAVSRCRKVAGQTIADISVTCEENAIAAWTGVWMMYQAVMVPLVSLFSVLALSSTGSSSTPGSGSDTSTSGIDDDLDQWRSDVERSIAFFEKMKPWSSAAKKSRDVVQRLYDATKYVGEHRSMPHTQHPVSRDMSSSSAVRPPQAITGVHPTTTSTVGDITNLPFAESDMLAEFPIMPEQSWSVNAEGHAVPTMNMNAFWDDMIWESFASEPLAMVDHAQAIAQLDARNVAGVQEQQDWPDWPTQDQSMRQW